MLFTSLNFLVFMPLVCLAYYCLPLRVRTFFLLAASYYFYINIQPFYVLLLVLVTLLVYGSTLFLDTCDGQVRRKMVLFLCVIICIGILFFFKYYNAVNAFVFSLLNHVGLRLRLPEMKWLLPVGISFFTFQSLGYLLDIYLKKYRPEKNIFTVALYVSFFPLILSGPIERGKNMFPQFNRGTSISFENVTCGLKFMLSGYFLKLVVAERLAQYLDGIFAHPATYSGPTLLLSSLLYPINIYADFAGYSLLALGAAKVLGYDVIMNFERPFCGKTVAEFWRRWHISLTTWLTDYVFTPLSISLRGMGGIGVAVASFIVFVLIGIWHGASWNYVIFGVIHGVYVAGAVLVQKKRKKFEKKHGLRNNRIYGWFCIGVTYILVAFAFIFFKTVTLADTWLFLQNVTNFSGGLYLGSSSVKFALMIFFSVSIVVFDFVQEYLPATMQLFRSRYLLVRWISYATLFIFIMIFGCFTSNSFVYFQF